MKNCFIKNLINWKLFFILVIACLITSFLVLPYALELTSSDGETTAAGLLFLAIQNLVLFTVVVFLGLLLSGRVGMGLPILQGALEGTDQTKVLKSTITPSVIWGVLAGVLILLFSLPFNALIPELASEAAAPAVWKGFLASFYGGIAEEVLLRLFVVSLIVWITFKIKKTADGRPTNFGVWLSIVLASILFGIGHLPATAEIVPLTTLVVIRAILLNGIGGIIFGWLYWKKGLESAIIAHFSADIVLHVITPAVLLLFQ